MYVCMYHFDQAQLRDGVDVVVGTPAKVWDWVQQGRLDLSWVHFFILDEGESRGEEEREEELFCVGGDCDGLDDAVI